LAEGWTKLLRSRLVAELESGGWEIRQALNYIWKKEFSSRSDAPGSIPDASWPSTRLRLFISQGSGAHEGLADKAELVACAVEIHAKKKDSAKLYTAEEVGAETDSDVNSRGMIRLFCHLIQEEGADPSGLIERAQARGQSGLEAASGESREERESSLEQLLTRGPPSSRRSRDAMTGQEREIAQLAGAGIIKFCQLVAVAVVHGASDEQWSDLEAKIADLEARNWQVAQAVSLLRVQVRDPELLTEGVDPRSKRIVQHIVASVEEVAAAAEQMSTERSVEDAMEALMAACASVASEDLIVSLLEELESIETGRSSQEDVVAMLLAHEAAAVFVDGVFVDRGDHPLERADSGIELQRTVSIGTQSRASVGQLRQQTNDDESFRTACTTIVRFCENVLREPTMDKFRTAKLAKPAVQRCVGQYEAAQDILISAGFVRIDEGTLQMQGSANVDSLRRICHVIKEELAK